jgi:hypothetical protein
MHKIDLATFSKFHSKFPEAAAPQTTPQTNGGQVTGFVS